MSEQEFKTGKIEPTELDITQFLKHNLNLIKDDYKKIIEIEPLDVFYNGLNIPMDTYVIVNDYVWKVIDNIDYNDIHIFTNNVHEYYYGDKNHYLFKPFINNSNKYIANNKYDELQLFVANKNEDKSIDYFLTFHNGGCVFGQALEYAIAKL